MLRLTPEDQQHDSHPKQLPSHGQEGTTGGCGGTGKKIMGQNCVAEVGCKKDNAVGCMTVGRGPLFAQVSGRTCSSVGFLLNAWPKLDFPIPKSNMREASETKADSWTKDQQTGAGFEVTAPDCTKGCSGPDLRWPL